MLIEPLNLIFTDIKQVTQEQTRFCLEIQIADTLDLKRIVNEMIVGLILCRKCILGVYTCALGLYFTTSMHLLVYVTERSLMDVRLR